MNLDVTAPLRNYLRATNRWPHAAGLRKYHEAISKCIDGDSHGVVEHVKSFIECVCITILREFGESVPSSTPSCTELLVTALKPLGLHNSRGAGKLDKVLSAFNRLAEALTEMRNENGPVAHGKDGFLDAIEEDHARAFLHTGDAIVGLILNALEGKQPDLLSAREPYERFKHLCERIDNSVGIKAEVDDEGELPVLVVSLFRANETETLELRIEPSRLLYGLDRTAFVDVLTNAPSIKTKATGKKQPPEAVAARTSEPSGQTEPPPVVVAKRYSGPLAPLRAGLKAYLIAEAIFANPGDEALNSLLATAEANMGLDWRVREALLARLKVGFRRVLLKKGADLKVRPDAPDVLLAWLQANAPP